jgi:hypothetical protein
MRILLRKGLPCTQVLIGLLLAVGVAATAAGEPPRTYCIRGAHIIPAPGEEIAPGTVLIRDGLIVAIGASQEAPPDAVVIEGEDLWIYPGLIDTDTRLDQEQGSPSSSTRPSQPPGPGPARQAARSGAAHPIALVHPEKRVLDSLQPFSGDSNRKVQKLRELGFTTVLVTPEKGIFRGSSSLVLLVDEAPVAEVVLQADAAQHIGFDRGRYGQGYPVSLMGTVATIRQVILDAGRHALWNQRYQADPRGMQRPPSTDAFAVLGDLIAGRQLAIFHADSPADLLLADRLADELGLTAIVSASGHEWQIAGQVGKTGRELILPLGFPDKPDVADDDEALAVTMESMRRYLQAPTTAATLHTAGVRFAFCSRGIKSLTDLRKNLRKIIDAGLPEQVALAALTTVPAEMLGVGDITGTIEPGKIANLVALDGPLFAEESAVRMVFVDGHLYRNEEKEKPKGGDPDAVVDPCGSWSVVFDFPGRPMEREWVIEGEPGSYAGTAETRSGTVSFDDVKLVGNMLTVVFPSQGGRGSMELTVVITGDELAGTAELGPRMVKVTGTRISDPEGGSR